jgi:hypothetical protein
MYKSVLLKGCVFQLKSNLNCLVEVVTVENYQAKVLEYNESGIEQVVIDISELKEIPLSIPILNSLGFEERKERLMGLPYEHYWQKQVNKHIVWIVDDNGILKYATIDANAYHGVRFSPAPYLHELQNIIGPVDVAKLYKDLQIVR